MWAGDICEGEERSDELNISDRKYAIDGIMLLMSLRSSICLTW